MWNDGLWYKRGWWTIGQCKTPKKPLTRGNGRGEGVVCSFMIKLIFRSQYVGGLKLRAYVKKTNNKRAYSKSWLTSWDEPDPPENNNSSRTWHSYVPLSRFWTYLICKVQSSEPSPWRTWKRSSLVYVNIPEVRMCQSRRRTQEIYK